jgi:hypothetical protein
MNVRGYAQILAALVLAVWICGTAAAQGTTIDEIGTVAAGETVTISGTTNLAPGNRLLVEVTPVAFGAGGAGGTSGTAVVQAGNGTANTWSFEANTTGFEPGEYIVTVDWVEGDATASTRFTVTEAGAATPTVTAPATTATTPPATTTEPGPTPTAAGPMVPAAAMIAAAAAGLLVRRR